MDIEYSEDEGSYHSSYDYEDYEEFDIDQVELLELKKQMTMNTMRNTIEFSSKTMKDMRVSFQIMLSTLKHIYSYCPSGEYLKILLDNRFDIQKASKYLTDGTGILYLIENKPVIELNQNIEHKCLVCYGDYHYTEVQHADCGHTLCYECCQGHFEVQIDMGPMRKLISCVEPSCNYYFPMISISKMVSPQKFEMLTNFWCYDIIECRRSLFYCKSKFACAYITEIENIPEEMDEMKELPAITMHCDCGYTVCMGCDEVGHDPLDCREFEKWSTKLGGNLDELKDMQWLKDNTKPCPNEKCKAPIQKNEGCMHMTCQHCNHQFCWLCLNEWKNHGNYYDCSDKNLIAKQNEL